MKISVLLLFAAVFSISAKSYSQEARVTFDLKNVSVNEVFNTIRSQTSYSFWYDVNDVDVNRVVSVKAKNKSVKEVLDIVFKNKAVDVRMVDNHIVIKTREMSNELPVVQQSRKITGIVKDATGEPVIGANVVEKGTTNGTITDIDGKYSLEINPNAVLIVSYIGYVRQELPVGKQESLDIVLKEDAETLDEVVVVGYGSQKKINLTGAISSVKMDDVLGDRPVGTVTQVLESAVPGLQISRQTGKPGSSMNMNIRGVTSTNNPEEKPLVLVDNVPMDLDMIDPNDIESVSVLKDAAAAAIYGARAAYGIILVTTKKGKKETPISFNYSNNFAFSNPTTLPKKIDPYSTVKAYNDLGIVGYFGGQDIPTWMQYMDEYYNKGMHSNGYVVKDGIRYNLAPTDVYDDMLSNTGFQQQHNLAMSGGSERANYRVSFGMIDEDGILYGDNDTYSRYNVSAFINMDVTNWLSGQLDVRYSESQTNTAKGNRQGSNSLWAVATEYQPMAPLGYGYDMNVESEENYLPFFSPRNMLELDNPQKDRKSDTRILGRIILTPIKDLTITGEYSFYRQWATKSYSPMMYDALIATSNQRNPSVTKNYYENTNWFSTTNAINLFATYGKTFNEDHNLKLMLGYNQESYHYESLWGKADDLIDQQLPSLSLSSGTQYTDDEFKEYALRSGFFRFNYDFKGKYLLEVNGRYDGSSRFAKESRFGFFPSFSAGWRLSEESFMEPLKKYVTNLKPRISWGTIGNQNVSNYGYMAGMNPGKLSNSGAFDGKGTWILPGGEDYVLSMMYPALVSSNYTWETVQTFDVGVDLGLLDNKLEVVFDWYKRDTKDMLAPYKSAPSVLGASFPNTNSASLQTKGWEISLQWRSNIGEKIRYNVGLNLYDSQSEITKYDNAQGILVNDGKLVFREGLKYGEIWGYTTDRFYTAADFDDNGNLLPGIPKVKGVTKHNPGDILFVDFDGNGEIDNGNNTIDNPGDMSVIGNNTARYQFSFNGGISWNNFDLSFLFTGTGKRDLVMPNYWSPNGTFVTSVFDFQSDYWREDNTESYWPRLYGDGGNNSANQKIQTKYLLNGSYLRLKNVTLGYNLPNNICEKLFIKRLRFFFSGENLFTWHHLPTGYNPDSFIAQPGNLSMTSGIQGDSGNGNWSYPLMRQISFGLNLTF